MWLMCTTYLLERFWLVVLHRKDNTSPETPGPPVGPSVPVERRRVTKDASQLPTRTGLRTPTYFNLVEKSVQTTDDDRP